MSKTVGYSTITEFVCKPTLSIFVGPKDEHVLVASVTGWVAHLSLLIFLAIVRLEFWEQCGESVWLNDSADKLKMIISLKKK